MRLIAFSILILAGSILMLPAGLGSRGPDTGVTSGMGWIIMIAGGILFLVEILMGMRGGSAGGHGPDPS